MKWNYIIIIGKYCKRPWTRSWTTQIFTMRGNFMFKKPHNMRLLSCRDGVVFLCLNVLFQQTVLMGLNLSSSLLNAPVEKNLLSVSWWFPVTITVQCHWKRKKKSIKTLEPCMLSAVSKIIYFCWHSF